MDKEIILISEESKIFRFLLILFTIILLLQKNYEPFTLMLIMYLIFSIMSPKIIINEMGLSYFIIGKQFDCPWSKIIRIRKPPNNIEVYLPMFPFVLFVFPWRPTYSEFVKVLSSMCPEKYHKSWWI